MANFEFIQNLLKDEKKNNLTKVFNFTFSYIGDVLLLYKHHFDVRFHLILPSEFAINDYFEIRKSASYLDLFIDINTDVPIRT